MADQTGGRAQAREVLRQRKAQFETLLNEAPIGIYVVDAQLRLCELNPVARAAFAAVPNPLGHDFNDAIHTLWPDPYANDIVAMFRHTLETGEPHSAFDRTDLRRDRGVIESYDWHAGRIPLPDGDYGVVCYFRDTSAEVRSRIAITESEERFRAIIDQTAAGVAQTDLSGKVELVNDRFCELTGYSRVELQQLRMQDITHPDDLPRNLELFQRLITDGTPFAIEKRYIQKDGQFIWVSNTVSVARNADGQFHRVIAVSLDINERKRNEALLARQNRILEMIAKDAALDETLTALVKIIEEQSDGLLGSMLVRQPGLDRFYLGIAPSLPEAYTQALNSAQTSPPYVGPCGMATDLGQTVIVVDIAADQRWSPQWRELVSGFGLRTCYSSPILASDGRVLGAFGMYYRKARDANPSDTPLIKMATHLAGIAIERKLAEEALREADRRKDEFLAMLAHELRNPLAAISSASELLSLQSSASTQVPAAAVLKRQIRHLSRLVDDLLDLARISQGWIELRKDRFALAGLVMQAIESVQPLMDQRGHRLGVEPVDSSLAVNGDPVRLVQCIANVLNNAAKYTPEGGRISLRVSVEEGFGKIEIEDNGVGISAEFLPHVFDLFVQGDRSLARTEGGLGIGLSLVKRLIQLHDGSVEAFSLGVGQGARFTLRLPLVENAPAPVHMPSTDSHTSRRVLVVDDNCDVADSLTTLLELIGYETATAYDPFSALETSARFSPDVVLLDIGLPQLDGYEVARRMREMPELAGARFIALTGYGRSEDKRRAQAAGFDAHLVKPVSFEALRRALANP